MGGFYWIIQQQLESTIADGLLVKLVTFLGSGVPQGCMQGAVPVAQAKRSLTSSISVLGGVWQCIPKGRGGGGVVQTSRSYK